MDLSLSAYDNRILDVVRYRGIVTRPRLEEAVPDLGRSLDRSLRRLEAQELVVRWITQDHGAIYASADVAAEIRNRGLELELLRFPARKNQDAKPEPCGLCKQAITTPDDALDHLRVHVAEQLAVYGAIGALVVGVLESLTASVPSTLAHGH